MDDLLSEKEQIEQLRSWWSEYGAYVIGGIVLGAALLFGINYYQSNKLEAELAASGAYEDLVESIADGKLDEADTIATRIATDYPKTSYAPQADLAMARLYMDKNRDQDAADALLAVVNSSADDELKHVARLRLARVYLYQNKAQEAVDLLQGKETAAFNASYGEVLGDAYAALDRIADAQSAYQEVLLDPLAQGTVDQQLVQWKALVLPDVASDETVDDGVEANVESDVPEIEESE